jgi:hypothetical protein
MAFYCKLEALETTDHKSHSSLEREYSYREINTQKINVITYQIQNNRARLSP